MPNGCTHSRLYCATGHEAVFVVASTETFPVRHYLIRPPKLECEHTSMRLSMLNHTRLPLPLLPFWFSPALVFLSGGQKIRFLPPGYHHNSRLICAEKKKKTSVLSICRTVINVGSVAILILEHRSLGEGFKLILRRTDDFLLPWHRQEIEVAKKNPTSI